MDALFATHGVMSALAKNNWDYIIKFSKHKNKKFARLLNQQKKQRITLPCA